MKFPVLVTALSLLVAGAAQAVPDVVSYAARVENDAGLFSGTVSATFQLFGAATGDTELWSENAASIVVIGGDLAHDLGSIEPLDDTVLARDDLFLQVTINGDVLEPRAAIRAVPFALLAKNAEVAARAVVDAPDTLYRHPLALLLSLGPVQRELLRGPSTASPRVPGLPPARGRAGQWASSTTAEQIGPQPTVPPRPSAPEGPATPAAAPPRTRPTA